MPEGDGGAFRDWRGGNLRLMVEVIGLGQLTVLHGPELPEPSGDADDLSES